MWNSVEYFKDKCKRLKFTRKDYEFCRVTGINQLEDVLMQNQGKKNYFAVDDTDDGVTIRKGGGYFKRRVVTVFLLKKYDFKNQAEREARLAETRLIRDKLIAKLIKDSNDLPEMYYLDKSRFPYKEVPGFFAVGTCGIYFFVTIEEPTALIVNPDDWD